MIKSTVLAMTIGVASTGTQYAMQQPVEANQCAQIKGAGEYYLVLSTGENFASIVNMNGVPAMKTEWIDDLVRVSGRHCFGKSWEES